MVPPGSHALDPEVRLVVVVRPGPRGFEGGVGSQPGSASEPFRLGAGDRRRLSPDAHDRQVAVRAGPGDPTGPDHAGVSPRGAERGAADGITLPSASVRPGTQSLVRGGRVGYLHVSGDGGSTRGGCDLPTQGLGGGGCGRFGGVPRSSSCSTCPSVDGLDTRTPWRWIRDDRRVLRA